MECREVTPEQVGFPGARLIARLRRRVRRHGQKSTETVYLISSLTLEQLDARGWLKLKRGYWVIESRLHHALDVSLDEDRSRVRQPNAALLLGDLCEFLHLSAAQRREVLGPQASGFVDLLDADRITLPEVLLAVQQLDLAYAA